MKRACLFVVLLVLSVFAFPAFAGQVAKDVSFETSDGVKIAATYYTGGKGKPGLVLLHMLSRNRSDWKPFAFDCQEKGYHVLAIDLRGHGGSTVGKGGKVLNFQKFTETDYGNMKLDAEAAVQWLAGQGADEKRIGLVGASIGANVALVHAASAKTPIKTVVLLSPGLDYRGVSITRAARDYRGPTFTIAASGDDYSANSVRELSKDAASPVGRTKIYKGKEHGTNMFGAYPDLEKLLLDWFAGNLD